MNKLQTRYLGLSLNSPIVVSSSGLTNTVDKLKRLEEAGAGAVVLKSLFEEQINHEASSFINANVDSYPEAEDYIRGYVKSNSVEEYLNLIEQAKKEVTIPVIASVNCFTGKGWTDFVKKMEDAGADAIEINVFIVPTDKDFTSGDYEKIYLDLAVQLRNTVKIPIAFKLGNHFTNLPYMVDQLYFRGINGVVLFNRFYEPDIDIHQLRLKSSDVFSNSSDLRQTLRWVAIVSDQVEKMDIAASTGVHSGEAAIKMLLAGANAVQVCSVLYKEGHKFLGQINNYITTWMDQKELQTISDFRGNMNYKGIGDAALYERAQFMKYFSDYN